MAILRVNQIDPTRTDAVAGWADGLGAIESTWPAGLRAFELRVVPNAPNGGAESDVRSRVRQLLIEATGALTPQGGSVVVRIDGPLTDVAAVLAWGLDKPMAMSAIRRFDTATPVPIVSFRASATTADLNALCDTIGPAIGRHVRVRLFAVPAELVPPLLDIDDLDDERWPEILSAADLVVDTIANLGGVLLLTRRSADELTTILTDRLAR